MAILKSKQLNPNLTGSFVLSGSSQTLVGTTVIKGFTTLSGSATLKGTSADLRISKDNDNTLVKLETDSAGSSALKLYDDKYFTVANTVDLNSSDTNAFKIASGSTTVLNLNRDDVKLTIAGDVSGSASSTGSFGNVQTTGNIVASGRILEQGTSVIDHATAMAIVFGG